MRAENLKFRNYFRSQAESPVKSDRVVVAFGEIISRGEKSDVVLSADIAFQPDNSDVGVKVNETLDAAA